MIWALIRKVHVALSLYTVFRILNTNLIQPPISITLAQNLE